MDSNYDIALINSYHGDPLSSEWFNTIQEKGKRCIILTPNPNEYATLKQQKIEVIYLNDYFPSTIPSEAAIKKYFLDLGITDFANYILNEQAYYNQSLPSIKKVAYQYAYAYHAILDKFSIDCFLHFTQGGEVIRRVATLIAENRKIKVLYLGETFIPGTMTMYSDENRTLIDPRHNRILKPTEIQEIIRSKIEKKTVVNYETDKRAHQPIPFLNKIFNHIVDKNWYIIKAYLVHKRMLHIDPFVKKTYLKSLNFYQTLDALSNEKYFYYPLNVGAESELYIRNPDFVDQVGAVERLAAHIPEGFKLFVKTHPSKEGFLPLKDYFRLKALKNVHILDPRSNSYDIVKKSQGVLLVSGTIALEGYLIGKPICIMGHWPFKKMGDFILVNSLSEVFSKILQFHGQRITPEDLIVNLYAYSFMGSVYSNKREFEILVGEIIELLKRETLY